MKKMSREFKFCLVCLKNIFWKPFWVVRHAQLCGASVPPAQVWKPRQRQGSSDIHK